MTTGIDINLTDELIDKICDKVRNGCPFDYGFILNGISKTQGYVFRAEGRKDETQSTQKYKLWSKMNAAKAEFCKDMVERVGLASQDPQYWTAAMTTLQRRDPANYSNSGSRQENDVDPITVNGSLEELNLQMAQVLNDVQTGRLDSDEALKRSSILSNAANIKDKTETRLMVEDLKDEMAKKG